MFTYQLKTQVPSDEAVSNVLKSISHVEFRGYLTRTRMRAIPSNMKEIKTIPVPPLGSPDVLGLEVFELLLRLHDKDSNMMIQDDRWLQSALRIFRQASCSMQYRIIAFLSCVRSVRAFSSRILLLS